MVTQPGQLLASDELSLYEPSCVYDHLGQRRRQASKGNCAFQGVPLTGGIPACFEGEEGAVGHEHKEDLPVCGPHHAVMPMRVPL